MSLINYEYHTYLVCGSFFNSHNFILAFSLPCTEIRFKKGSSRFLLSAPAIIKQTLTGKVDFRTNRSLSLAFNL